MSQSEPVAQDRAHELPDGRTLAWCEYGSPDGPPVFYFHGIPGSRIDGRFAAEVAAAEGIRLVAMDRPGFGRSSPEAGRRSYEGWAGDIESLADALDLDRFAIVAYSSGGPYALAAGIYLSDRVTRLATVSGVAPSEMPNYRRGVCPTDRTMSVLALRARWLARFLMGRAIKQARQHPERFGKSADRDFPAPADQELLDAGVRSLLPQLFLEAGRSGPAGMVEDFAVWARPSGLAFERMAVPLHLWHGEDDRTIPVDHSRWIASQVPSAELTVWPGVGHLHTPVRWGEVYAALR
jgi:pimeloyl-ACP methyl ester carboxylesterase